MITKQKFDVLAKKYETKDFIKDDPIQFPHMFQSKEDIEISAFLASLFAYGNRKAFIPKLSKLFSIMDMQPYNYVMNFVKDSKDLDDFDYRFSKGCDIKEIVLILQKLYKEEKSSLESLFAYGWSVHKTVKGMLITVSDYFYSNVCSDVTKGFYHLIPDAKKTSALKRMNMFLRWMIRKSDVDLGCWTFISPAELIIPLDVHVGRLSVQTGLISKSNGDFKTAVVITNALKKFDFKDPVRYDFALFGYGVNNK